MSSDPPSLENLDIAGFDPHVCAKLYNQLVEKAAALRPEFFNPANAHPVPNDDIAQGSSPEWPIADRVTPEVAAFVKECRLYDGIVADTLLMPFINPLSLGFFLMYRDWFDDEDSKNYLCLCRESHDGEGGLFLDQTTGRARFISFPRGEGDGSYDAWVPLQEIFENWLDMWDLGHICLDYDGDDPTDPNYIGGPCFMNWHPENVSELDRTLEIWTRLLDGITARMPAESFIRDDEQTPWISEIPLHVDMRSGVAQRYTFTKGFLERARRPPQLKSGRPFCIAPGLTVPSVQALELGLSSITSQIIFPTLATRNSNEAEGIHLIHGGHPRMDHVSYFAQGVGGRIDSNHSDWKLFQPFDDSNTYIDCPWNPHRRLRLVDILEMLIAYVEQDGWTIGADGVEGSLEFLKDTAKNSMTLPWQHVML
jgi:hypothetical protein